MACRAVAVACRGVIEATALAVAVASAWVVATARAMLVAWALAVPVNLAAGAVAAWAPGWFGWENGVPPLISRNARTTSKSTPETTLKILMGLLGGTGGIRGTGGP